MITGRMEAMAKSEHVTVRGPYKAIVITRKGNDGGPMELCACLTLEDAEIIAEAYNKYQGIA